jgi:GAF domain-containing protein
MPYLSWAEGELLHRHYLDGDGTLGRDPSCLCSLPQDPSVSRQHAKVHFQDNRWWIRDLGSRNGTILNGEPLPLEGKALADLDEIGLGDWKLTFTEGFPGLDGVNFIERVGDLYSELLTEPSQALVLIRGLELLHRSTEALLREGSSQGILYSILSEALKLLDADRGFVVMVQPDGSWQTIHSTGNVDGHTGLSRSVLSHVARHRTGVLSNAPMVDPRFGGVSLVELHRGAMMCVPMETDGAVVGMLYLDRMEGDRPFSRFDLALFQAFVRQGTLAHRHTQLSQRAISQAEIQGELLRLKSLLERVEKRTGETLNAMSSSLRWLQLYAERSREPQVEALRHEVGRLQTLVDVGIHESELELPQENAYSSSLAALQALFEPAWAALLELRGARLALDPVPSGVVWMAGGMAPQALMGLVEPLLLRISEGNRIVGSWVEEAGNWILRLRFPIGVRTPTPDAWTQHSLQNTGIVWRWSDQYLNITFPKGIDTAPEQPPMPFLGMVTEAYDLIGLFQSVAEANSLALFPLEEEPPLPPLPRFRYLVVDARGTKDPVACIQTYRRHPSFSTVPILVVRAQEEIYASLLAAGANDWLPEGFRWETLQHRLQVLKGHEELQRKAMAAERLDSIRKMAGTLKHEINNPLAIISMQVELLQRKYPEEPKFVKIDEMVGRIRDLMQVLQKMREAPDEDYPGGGNIVRIQ